MRQALLMPKLGLTMTEGTIAEWSVSPGQRFEPEQTLLVVETEKVSNDVGAESSGVMLEIVETQGAVVAVGDVIAYWDDEATDAASSQAKSQTKVNSTATLTSAPAPELGPAMPAAATEAGVRNERLVATPYARRLAEQGAVDLSRVMGSGPQGRIRAADVVPASGGAPITSPRDGRQGPALAQQQVRPSATQATMARRLTAAKQQIPHFYLALEADVGRLLEVRESLLDGGRPSINDFILAALGRALRDQPEADRVWVDDTIVPLGTSDVGVAVHCERGLFVPIIRGVGQLPLAEVSRAAREAIERAREGRLSEAEMGGGAVTVSNAGMFGVTYLTPIINPGQAMILGVGSVRDVFRPDEQGRPVLGKELGLVLACDHRILDGVAGLRFLNAVRQWLERPDALLVA